MRSPRKLLFSSLYPSWIEEGPFLSAVPVVVNYDDAIFHWYEGQR